MRVVRTLGALVGLAIFVAFCAAGYWLWRPGADVTVASVAAPQSTLSQTRKDGQGRLSDLIAPTTERPLFHASRRPPVVEAPAPAPVPPPPPEVTLSLVGILGEETDRIALVRLSSGPELYRLKPGDSLAEWRILTIGSDAIQLRKNGSAPFIVEMEE